MRDLVPFAQFKKSEKPATLLKITLLRRCFLHFLNCTNGTKSRNASHISFICGNFFASWHAVSTSLSTSSIEISEKVIALMLSLNR